MKTNNVNNIDFNFFGLKSPYGRFDKSSIAKNCEIKNWQYTDSISTFNQLILETNPKIIVELGTYLGWSAINMAQICKKNKIDCKILCVDTWLGSEEHWRSDRCNSLSEYNYFENGTSIMFDTFCKNVISHELENYIIPIPNTTNTCYKLLSHYNIKADLIYVDASHEYEDVLRDLTSYYTLLNENGCIFGDDVNWPEVDRAATEFSKNINKQVHYSTNKNLYFIKKEK